MVPPSHFSCSFDCSFQARFLNLQVLSSYPAFPGLIYSGWVLRQERVKLVQELQEQESTELQELLYPVFVQPAPGLSGFQSLF